MKNAGTVNWRPSPTDVVAERPGAAARPLNDAVVANLTERRVLARAARAGLLGATDLLALIVAGVAAYLLWALPQRGQSIDLYLNLAPLFVLFILGYAQAGLYPGFGLGPVETLRRLSYVTAFGFLVLAAFSFALKLPAVYSRVTFFVAFVFSLVTLPVSRILVWRLAGGARWWSEPVVVIGTGQRAARAIRALNEARHLGYRPVAVLALAPHTAARDVEGVPLRGGLDAVPGLAAAGIRVALVETDQLLDPATVDRLQRDFRHVVLLRDFDDLPVEGIQVRNLGGVVGIEYTNNLLLYGNRIVKRIVDVVIAGLALLVAAPVIVFASALVRLLDGGPAFFTQDRTGLEGRRIIVPKIRTMRQDAETRLEEHLAADPVLREEWDTRYKLRNDPRLIPIVGRFFRRFSVDELPQLWAVLDGRMSLVGPRPFPDYHMKNFSQSFLDLRRRVRPGITGLWQVTVRSDGGIDKQESYDTYYIRNWSVWLDIYVLSRTIAAVASGRGAY